MSVTKIYNKDILDSIVSGFFFTKGNKTDHNKGPSCKSSDQNQTKLNLSQDYVQTKK